MVNEDTFMHNYYLQHWCCPKCGSRKMTSTLMGFVFDKEHPEKYQDRNICDCTNCGWHGITHELAPKPGFKEFNNKLKEIANNGYSDEAATELLDIAYNMFG